MLLGDLAGFQTFRREATELREELRDYQREQFDGWSRHVLAAVDHPTEPLRWAKSSQGMGQAYMSNPAVYSTLHERVVLGLSLDKLTPSCPSFILAPIATREWIINLPASGTVCKLNYHRQLGRNELN